MNVHQTNFADELAALKARGMTFVHCVDAFSVSTDDSPHLAYAYDSQDPDTTGVKINPVSPVVPSEENAEARGAWVVSWTWVSDEQAGVISHGELLTHVARYAHTYIARGATANTPKEIRQHARHVAYAKWLEHMLSTQSARISEMDKVVIDLRTPMMVTAGEDPYTVEFYPATAMTVLNSVALLGGLPLQRHLEAQLFISRNEAKLNCLLA